MLLGPRVFLSSALTPVRPAAPILEQQKELSRSRPGGSSREVRDALETRAGQSKGRREPRCGWEAGAVLTLRLGKPSPGDVVLRRRWDQGHCCPARTPSTTPHRVLLIAELKKIPVFVHDQLESWEMLQSVSWGCRGH